MIKIVSFIFILSYSYALVRYHIGKNIPFSDFLFIVNKSISWTAFLLISITIIPKSFFKKNHLKRKYFGLIGYAFAVLHLILNLILLNKNHYPSLYVNDVFNLKFYVISLIGLISFVIFSVVFLISLNIIKTKNRDKSLKLGFYGILILAFHPMIMGIQNWFKPNTWPYFLPPITLLCVLFLILFLLLRYIPTLKNQLHE